MESAIELFSIFGGLGWDVDIDADIEELLITNILDNFGHLYNEIENYISADKSYYRLLHALAVSDRRLPSAFKRAHLNNVMGGVAINYLQESGILNIENSREEPVMKEYPKQKLKREIVQHRISPKVSFTIPFVRFWFYFIYPHRHEIEEGNYEEVLEDIHNNLTRYTSLVFEELSNIFLVQQYLESDRIVDYGSYWDRVVEIDILAHTESGKTIVGECKWTNHIITKRELSKLEEKCAVVEDIEQSLIVFFSKRGFSNEMLSMKSDYLHLYNAEDFQFLLENLSQDDLIEGFSAP